MTAEQWQCLKNLFAETAEKDSAGRDLILARALANNAELLAEARRLLAGHDAAGDFLSNPPAGLAAIADAPPWFVPGCVIAGRFRIIRFLARGGMGEVYEAEDMALSTKVALKTIQAQLASGESAELFRQEILSGRRVTHPNVCRIYDVAEHVVEDGGPPVMLLTMELLEGQTLSLHLKEHGPFSRDAAMPLIEQICAGLQAAHDAGVIHRDFKTGNVILAHGPDGLRPVITDFGLALPAGSRPAGVSAAGTPGYMAPEQLEGAEATPATDVYALGVVIAKMIGGKAGPWRGVLGRCAQSVPAKRYQRAVDVAAALQRGSAVRIRSGAIAAAVLACLLVAAWLILGPADHTTEDRLVASDSGIGYGSISEDGRYLIVMTSHGLAIRDLRRGTTRTIVSEQRGTTGGLSNALLSPDIRQIAYVSRSETQGSSLRVVPFSGGATKTLLATDAPIGLYDWSPDSKRLLIGRGERGNGAGELAWVEASTGAYHTLKSVKAIPVFASLSPEGRYIAFARSGDIYVLAADGSTETAAIRHPAVDNQPRWTSDGSRLLFVSNRTGDPALWAVPMTDGRVAGEPQLVRTNIGPDFLARRSARSNSLYYTLTGPHENVMVGELDPNLTAVPGSPSRIEEFVNSNTLGSWSPDGESLAYMSVRAGKLMVRQFRSSQSREVRTKIHPLGDTPIIWFRDNRSVLVVASPRVWTPPYRPTGFYRVDVATGEERLLHDKGCAFFDLSPSGDSLYFIRSHGVTHAWAGEMVEFRISSGRETILQRADAKQSLRWVSVSPDGRHLAYVFRDDSAKYSSLRIMPSEGGEAREVYRREGEDFSENPGIAWTPDQHYLLLARGKNSPEGSDVSLYRIPVEGGDAVSTGIRLQASGYASLRYPSVHPDGRHIVYTTSEAHNELHLLENFLPKVSGGRK